MSESTVIQQQKQQQQQPPLQKNQVMSDSTLVVIVCSIFASLVGAIFIVCLLRAVCRDLPARFRAWRRRRLLGRKLARQQERHQPESNGFIEMDDGIRATAVSVPTISAANDPNRLDVDDGYSVGFMLMHTRQASVDVLNTVGLSSRADGDSYSDEGGGCGGGSGGGPAGGSKRHRRGQSLGPRGQPIDREYFV